MSMTESPSLAEPGHASLPGNPAPLSHDAAARRTEHELTPVAPDARLLQLDVLRGLALFGVLLVNLGRSAVPVGTGSQAALSDGMGRAALDFALRTFLESRPPHSWG